MGRGTITDEMLPAVYAAWDEGKSASEIARTLSEAHGIAVTRNMIIGKVYRRREADRRAHKGTTLRQRPSGPAPKPVEVRKVSMPAPEAPAKPVPVKKVKLPTRNGMTAAHRYEKSRPRGALMGAARAVAALTGCKFPIGDVAAPDFHFCNAEPRKDRPYCDTHCAVAYNGIPRKTPKARPFL